MEYFCTFSVKFEEDMAGTGLFRFHVEDDIWSERSATYQINRQLLFSGIFVTLIEFLLSNEI